MLTTRAELRGDPGGHWSAIGSSLKILVLTDYNLRNSVRCDVQNSADDEQHREYQPQWATKKGKRPPVEHGCG